MKVEDTSFCLSKIRDILFYLSIAFALLQISIGQYIWICLFHGQSWSHFRPRQEGKQVYDMCPITMRLMMHANLHLKQHKSLFESEVFGHTSFISVNRPSQAVSATMLKSCLGNVAICDKPKINSQAFKLFIFLLREDNLKLRKKHHMYRTKAHLFQMRFHLLLYCFWWLLCCHL